MKGKLVGLDGYTIYRVHIEGQNKVIRVKDLPIFEDTSAKAFLALSDFDGKPTFNKFQLSEEKNSTSKSNNSEDNNTNSCQRPTALARPKQTRAGRTIKPTPKVKKLAKATSKVIPLPNRATPPPNPENTKALIMLLTKLLSDD